MTGNQTSVNRKSHKSDIPNYIVISRTKQDNRRQLLLQMFDTMLDKHRWQAAFSIRLQKRSVISPEAERLASSS